MSHPKRQAIRAIGLLAAVGVVAFGLAAGSPGRGLESGVHGRPAGNRHQNQHRPGCPGRAPRGGES
jgi:hypothetical protein